VVATHQAPLGSSRQEVMVLVARRGWKFHPEYRGRFINKSIPRWWVRSRARDVFGVHDVKVDAYWKFSGSDNLDEVYVNKWKEGF
jgi:hypothetical protein